MCIRDRGAVPRFCLLPARRAGAEGEEGYNPASSDSIIETTGAVSYTHLFYRHMKVRLRGAPQAITAAAHKLARIIYTLVVKHVQYDDSVFAEIEQRNREDVYKRQIFHQPERSSHCRAREPRPSKKSAATPCDPADWSKIQSISPAYSRRKTEGCSHSKQR